MKGQRSGAGPAWLAHLQDVASPEAELGVAGGREVVLPLSLHQDQADRRDPGPFCRRRKQKPASLRLTGLNQLQSESLVWKIISRTKGQKDNQGLFRGGRSEDLLPHSPADTQTQLQRCGNGLIMEPERPEAAGGFRLLSSFPQ